MPLPINADALKKELNLVEEKSESASAAEKFMLYTYLAEQLHNYANVIEREANMIRCNVISRIKKERQL